MGRGAGAPSGCVRRSTSARAATASWRWSGAVCGVHAQVQASAELQLAARVDGSCRPTSGRRCGSERALVKAWTVRGTLHLHPAERAAALVRGAARGPALGREGAACLARSRGRAPPGGRRRRGRGGSGGGLGGAGRSLPLTRRAHGGGRGACRRRCRGSGCARGSPSSSASCARGRRKGRGSRSRGPDQWIEGWQEVADEDEALREVCRRFLRTYGPARPADFREWFAASAFTVADARALFESLARRPGGDRRRRSPLPSSWPATGRSRRRAAQVRLLPEYDVYVMGFRERDQLVPQPVRELVATHGRGRYEGACRGALRAGRRSRRGAVGAREARQADRAQGSARTPTRQVAPRGARA